MVVIRRKDVDKTNYLVHHGIKGQKWGEKNGPPYPLSYGSHSSAEKKMNSKSSIDGNPETGKKNTVNSGALKKLGKAALITAGVVAVGAVSYKALENGELDGILDAGKAFIEENAKNAVDKAQLGKTFEQIDKEMVKSINKDLAGSKEGLTNCFCTSTTYINNSLFGRNEKALGIVTKEIDVNGKNVLGYVDPVSGMFVPGGPNVDLYSKLYNGIKTTSYQNSSFINAFNKIPKSSTGVMRIQQGNLGHFINYECDKRGRVSIVDGQSGRVFKGDQFADICKKRGWSLSHVLDFSNASINESATFNGIVKSN